MLEVSTNRKILVTKRNVLDSWNPNKAETTTNLSAAGDLTPG